MDYNNVKGNLIVVFRSGREANAFCKKYQLKNAVPFDKDQGWCAWRFMDGKYVSRASEPFGAYSITMGSKRGEYCRVYYDVVFYTEKAVVL